LIGALSQMNSISSIFVKKTSLKALNPINKKVETRKDHIYIQFAAHN